MNKIFNDYPETTDLFCESSLFLPKNISNGRNFQLNSLLGAILSFSPIDCEPSVLLSNIRTTLPVNYN